MCIDIYDEFTRGRGRLLGLVLWEVDVFAVFWNCQCKCSGSRGEIVFYLKVMRLTVVSRRNASKC